MSGKVGGPSGPRPPVESEPAQGSDPAAAADPARETAFAGKVDEAAASAASSAAASVGPASPTASTAPSDPIARIAADLDAGSISPEMAIQRIVDATIDAQLGPDAPAALRDELRAVLEQLLHEDPHLGSLGARIGARPPDDDV
jgi:hypothetical protein